MAIGRKLGTVTNMLVVAVAVGFHAATAFEQSVDEPVGVLRLNGEVILVVNAIWVDEVERGVVVTVVGEEAFEKVVVSEGVGWDWRWRWNVVKSFEVLVGN